MQGKVRYGSNKIIKSSHRRCTVKKTFLKNFLKIVLKNFTIFTGKHLCWSLFLIKLQVWRPATLSKEALTQVFPCKYCEIFKSTYFQEHLRTTASNNIIVFFVKVHFWSISLIICYVLKKHLKEVHLLRNSQQIMHSIIWVLFWL